MNTENNNENPTAPEEVSNTENGVANQETVQTETDSTTAESEPKKEADSFEEISSRLMEETEEEIPSQDYSKLNIDGLLKSAVEANNHTPKDAIKRLKDINSVLEEKLRDEKKEALNAFIAADNNPDDFTFDKAKEVRAQFDQIFTLAKEAVAEEKSRIESEKKKNLARKKELLSKLETITQSDETMDSLEEVKEIQREWKTIRVLPKENVQELWDAYHVQLDKFYDNHSINIELKELDRKKNLAIKIDLCEKVLKLKDMDSLKKSFILLNKYNEEFKNTGPVPREFNKEIWEKFREACDSVYNSKKELLELEDQKRNDNLKLKEVLVEKASLVASKPNKTAKDWKNRTNELDQLMEEWKAIGQVPRNVNEDIWKRFRASFNEFYKNKNHFFKDLFKHQKANLILKEDLCKRAEEIQSRTDFADATKEILKLQEEWKGIGPVPDKVSNAVWKRFRKACDTFFNAKQNHYNSQKTTELENQKKKEAIIARIETLAKDKDAKKEDILAELKTIQAEWREIGFVPFKAKNAIQKKYNEASDSVYAKFKINKDNLKAGQLKDHYESLVELPNGVQQLMDEERKLRKKIDFLNGEIDTWETNIQFFARSKNADKLKAEIGAKVAKAQEQVQRMSKEKRMIRQLIQAAQNQD